MAVEDFLYGVGEFVEGIARSARGFLFPVPSEEPPKMSLLKRLVRRKLSVHELLSLELQLTFIVYLLLALVAVLKSSPTAFLAISALYFLTIRYTLLRNMRFFIEFEPYRAFYYSLSGVAFFAYGGYLLLRRYASGVYYFYGYLVALFIGVALFRRLFRSRYGREWTYGVVEEVKGSLVKISTHDDVRANVKPGAYWVEAAGDVEVGDVVKVLVEERPLRGAVPRKILEAYKSSETSTEPKEETE